MSVGKFQHVLTDRIPQSENLYSSHSLTPPHTHKRARTHAHTREGVKPADIYRRLQAHYGDETLSRSKTSEWCKCFKDGRTSVSDDPGRGGSQPTAVIPVNIQCVECLILDNRHITSVKVQKRRIFLWEW